MFRLWPCTFLLPFVLVMFSVAHLFPCGLLAHPPALYHALRAACLAFVFSRSFHVSLPPGLRTVGSGASLGA